MQNSLKAAASVALGLALAVTLTACGGAPEPSATPTPSDTATATATPSATPSPTPITPSASLDGITVTGEAGAAPAVTVPSPWAIDQTRTRVVTEGHGVSAAGDSYVKVNYVGVNGRTGQVFDSSWAKGTPAVFSLSQVVPGFTKGLTGAKVGERVLIGMPGTDGYDSSGGSPQAGIQVGDSLVFVVDVLATSVGQASGTINHPTLPVTVHDDGGKPVVTIPSGATPPSTLVAENLITGDQPAVAEGDVTLVKYRGWSWKTGQMIDDGFDAADAAQLSEMIPGWRAGLVGRPIGSRVLLIIPPDQAYPNGNASAPTVEAGDTLVYVVDILFSTAKS
ncbi:FKBP-type peptidyl-prolyl cis-trans isomerase [Propioniciclava flava]|uniref:peptidylprolyl isomerase n=1 Tax=Propioniciclava flava TaxID=2072026 RepID=A0A4Q2EJA2_9ACTN|nr:FKBP-type peptidyl-prolyl cis-trans isomerase [Propioniciclava flava]RXW33621.1 peptidylprolyl isomerase [Propioniciclava flava]